MELIINKTEDIKKYRIDKGFNREFILFSLFL